MFYAIRTFWAESFRLPPAPLTEKNLPDQTGKVYIITGSNTGVGYHVASILYAHNAKVYVGARSEDKGVAAIDSLKKLHPTSKGSLHFLKLNLSDLSTIKESVNDFLSREDKLHWLDNNAGVMTPPKDLKGAQGLDLTYQTNILGPFLLTKLLLPILRRTAESEARSSVRVSWAGSLAVVLGSPKYGQTWKTGKDGQQTLDDTKSSGVLYATSKAANYYLAHEFGRRFRDHGVLHNTYNPGNLRSDLQRHISAIQMAILNLLLYPGIFGAYTEIYAGLSTDLTIEKDQGAYIVPWGRKSGVRSDLEAEVAKGASGEPAKLFDWCDRVTKDYQ